MFLIIFLSNTLQKSQLTQQKVDQWMQSSSKCKHVTE